MESKALKLTPKIESVQSFPKPDEKKKVKARFRLWTQKEMRDAECSELDEALKRINA